MPNSLPTVPAAPRSLIRRWVAVLVIGYIAGTALLVRDDVVQSRPTATAAAQNAAHATPEPEVAGR